MAGRPPPPLLDSAVPARALGERVTRRAPPGPDTPDTAMAERDWSARARMRIISAEHAEVPHVTRESLSYADHDQAWTARASAGPLQKVIDIAGADAVRKVMHDVLEADRKPDGQLRQDNVLRYVLAGKP